MIRLNATRILAAVALCFALAWSAVLLRPHLNGGASVVDRLEASLVDLRFLAAGSRPPPDDVLIVAVDDETARLVKAFPLPRDELARLVDKIFAGGAKAVALDFLFLSPMSPAGDDALAKALRAGPSVSAASAYFDQDTAVNPVGFDFIPQANDFDLPVEPIRSATALGFVNISTDLSGIPRHVPMLIGWNDAVWPALPLRLVELATGSEPVFTQDYVSLGGVATALDAGHELALRFYGRKGAIRTISAAKVLTGDPQALAALQHRIVIVGATANGTGDQFATPFDSVLPGVELLATAVANLHTGDALVRTSAIRFADAVITLLLAVAVVLLLTMRNIEFGLFGVAVLVVLLGAFASITFSHGLWFSLAIPLMAMMPVAIVTAAARLGLDRWTERKLRRQEEVLRAFQSPAIASQLAADPDFLAVPVVREIAVLFMDLTGFTGLTERIGPTATRELLREFHTMIEEEVRHGGGIVASYMGDGAMILWGLAERGPQDAAQALRTAIELQRRTMAWLKTVQAAATGGISVKLGAHFGSAVLSRLGHRQHQHITATGDTVNTAARLMEVAADHDYRLALSASLMTSAARQGFDRSQAQLTDIRDVAIRGRAQKMSVCFLKDNDP